MGLGCIIPGERGVGGGEMGDPGGSMEAQGSGKGATDLPVP